MNRTLLSLLLVALVSLPLTSSLAQDGDAADADAAEASEEATPAPGAAPVEAKPPVPLGPTARKMVGWWKSSTDGSILGISETSFLNLGADGKDSKDGINLATYHFVSEKGSDVTISIQDEPKWETLVLEVTSSKIVFKKKDKSSTYTKMSRAPAGRPAVPPSVIVPEPENDAGSKK